MTKTTDEQLVEALKKGTVMSGVLAGLLLVFKEAISQLNNDTQYFLEKLQLYNSIGVAMSDHLKELMDAMAADIEKDSEECKESWRLVLEEQQRILATLAEVTESYRKTTVHLLKQLG